MKKLIIGVAALGVMSFTTNQIYYGTQLVWAIDNLMVNGRIDEATAENYNELLDETQGFIEDFYEKQCR